MCPLTSEEFALEVDVGEAAPALVPAGVIHGTQPGPTTLLITGLHGTELLVQDLLQDVFTGTQPSWVRGKLVTVFCLDVLAAAAGVPAHNPRDRKNPNRVWPGDPHGTYSERLVSGVFTELVCTSETVIDLHGGEWNEDLIPFAVVPQGGVPQVDHRSLELAEASGVPLIETIEIDGASLGPGTLIAESCRAGKCSLAVEVGGAGRRTGKDREQGASLLHRILASAGHFQPLAPPGQPGTVLAGSIFIRSPVLGVLVPRVELGQRVEPGSPLADLHSFGGRLLQRVVSHVAGVVMVRSLARVVDEGGLIVKIGMT